MTVVNVSIRIRVEKELAPGPKDVKGKRVVSRTAAEELVARTFRVL